MWANTYHLWKLFWTNANLDMKSLINFELRLVGLNSKAINNEAIPYFLYVLLLNLN